MRLHIVKYGDPVLTREASAVTDFDGQLAELVESMFETMRAANGVGLAAPQVAVGKKLFVMDCSAGRDPDQRVVCINPQIVETKGTIVSEEGCLSFPEIYFEVERPEVVTVSALDVHGREFTIETRGLAARCVTHETDHLYGKVFIEYLSPLKRDLIKRRIKKKIKLGEWE
ncbi:MAG TPA: peptide deformylase [Blastocatellia bacterium]|nr:peptide deformylase [Blastocatellia bacterium]